jgi:hypothetical protein
MTLNQTQPLSLRVVPTPVLALEVQRGLVPGAPKALEFSVGFMGVFFDEQKNLSSPDVSQSCRVGQRRLKFESAAGLERIVILNRK